MAGTTMNRIRTLALILVAVFWASGCAIFGRTSDLQAVHETYRREFAKTFLPSQVSPGDAPAIGKEACSAPAASGYFPDTLEAIRTYEAKYRGDGSMSTELMHLKVLKAMIHLQVGNTGIARGLATEVRGARLSATDEHSVRDELLARALPHLADGWDLYCRPGARPTAFAEAEKYYANRIQGFAEAADRLLDSIDQPTGSKGPTLDDGAIYLATTAAIFHQHAFANAIVACNGDPRISSGYGSGSCATKELYCWSVGAKRVPLGRGNDSIGRLLTEDEKSASSMAAGSSNAYSKVVTPSRTRFVDAKRNMAGYIARGDLAKAACPNSISPAYLAAPARQP